MNKIKQLRKLKKITQNDLCKILNIAQPTLSGYETNTYEPDFETASKIADFFDVTLDYLLGRAESSTQQEIAENKNVVTAIGRGGDRATYELTDEEANLVRSLLDKIGKKK